MRRFVPLLLLLLLAIPAHAQEEVSRPAFKSTVVLVVDTTESMRSEVTESLERSFARLTGAEVVVFSEGWEGKTDWVVSVSAHPVEDDKGQLFQMGFAFAEAVDVVEAHTFLDGIERNSTISIRQLRNQVEKSTRGISDFRGMWVTMGRLETDIEPRCREAAALFDKNFLSSDRRRWNRQRTDNLKNRKYRRDDGQ